MKQLIHLFIISILICIESGAQEYSYIQYTEKDGLPSSTVYDLSQDKDGFMWFATENGVCRFDGTAFKTFTTKDGLPDNAVMKLHIEKSGRIWVMPFMYCPYYLKNDKFYPIEAPDSIRRLLASTFSIKSSSTKLFFISSTQAYVQYEKNKIVPIQKYWPALSSSLFPIEAIDDSILLVGNADSTYLLNGSKLSFLFKTKPFEVITWLNDEKKITSAEKVVNSTLNPKGSASQQVIYANEKDDLLFFSKKTGKFLYKIHSYKPTNSLIDNEGNVWVGTQGHGLFRYPSLAFNHLSFNSNVPEIFSIEKVGNEIISGSNFSKLYAITQNDFVSKDYSANLTISGNFPAKTSRQNRIYKLLYNGNDLYIGTDAFLIKKEISGKEIVKNIYPVKDLWIENKELLVCLSTGVLLLDAEDLSVKDTILRQRATAGIVYKNNYILGTIGGLVKVDIITKKITGLSQLHPSLEKRITSIKKGRNNDLWIATSGGGLVQFKDDKVIRNITADDGLTGDICSSLFINSDEIWAGTNKGINKIVLIKDSFSITRFTTADGLASNTINSIYADSNKVYAGSSAGLTYFDKSYTEDKSNCKLDILEATADGKKISLDSSYIFSYNILNIRFDFIAISFKSAGDIKYYYRLERLDDRWNLTENRYINFATLPPGTYTLNIKAKNKFGIESPVKSIRIKITPPWWKTWWFLTLVFAGTGSAIIFFYKRRITKIKKKEEVKRITEAQFAALEQQALQAQMNPHFIFNCLNSIQSFIIANDVYGANKYLSVFAGLIRQTLDHSSVSAISIAEEVKYLNTYLELERMRFKDKFTYTITIDGTGIADITIPAMIVQPFVENAIRHGIQHRTDSEGKIAVIFKIDNENNLYCIITDNGVGRKKASALKSGQHIEYQSKGTVITQKRINIINDQHKTKITIVSEDIVAEDNSIVGTKVTIYFPASFIKKTTYD